MSALPPQTAAEPLSLSIFLSLTPLWLSELLLQQYPIITISPAELQPAIITPHY